MSASNTRQKQNWNKKKVLLLLLVAFAAICVIVTSVQITKKLSYPNVYEGVYIGDTAVGGMSEDALKKKIPTLAKFSADGEITLTIDVISKTVSVASLSPAWDFEQMIEKAMEYGRTQKGLAQLREISMLKKQPVSVPFMLAFDEYVLQQTMDSFSDELDITAVENRIDIGEDSLTITRGTAGRGVDYQKVKQSISACLLSDSRTVSLQLEEIEPEEITVDYIKRHIKAEPKEAEYSVVDHRLVITQSNPGVVLNEQDVKKALDDAKGKHVFTIPATIHHPSVTTESLKATLLAEKLGTFSSDFSSSSADRAHNIQLACSKIDGYVLAPGEEFAYNEVVGPRTAAHGFRVANVYVGNTVQPGIGGGICQVSSTMFNAAVYADLEITARRNHTLPVNYVPMGRDATVSYGAVDFKFKNNYETPIEVRAECIGRKNVITIYGTNERAGREIKIETVKTGTSSPKVTKKEDDTLPVGVVKVEEPGTNGSSYIAYKIVYENGAEVKREVLCKSTYAGKDRVELIGTKEAPEPSEEPTDTPSSETPSAPEPTPAPSASPSQPAMAPEATEPPSV